MRALSWLLLLFAIGARAIHESEVGVVDWHAKLVGVPLTKPVLHDDLVLTATASNVLAALNATDGTIVWRSIHDAQDAIMTFRVHDDGVYALSGPSGSTLRVYDTLSGDLVREKRLHHPTESKTHDPPSLGLALAVAGDDRTVVLTNGDTVQCLCTNTLDTTWTWRSPDQGSLVRYTHIYSDPNTSTLYVAGFAKSVKSYTLHVTTLDLATGDVIASVNIPASITNALTDFLLLGPSLDAASATTDPDVPGPCLVWLSPSSSAKDAPFSLFSAPLPPSLKGKVMTLPNASYKRIQDVDLTHKGLFLAFRDDGATELVGYQTSGSPVRVVWDFGNVSAGTHFSGVLGEDGNPHIGSVAWSDVHNQVVHQTFEADLHQGTGKRAGFAFPFETNEHGTIRQATFSPTSSIGSQTNETHKLLLVTSTGSLQLWDRNVLQWVREESLATVQTATIVELPPSRDDVPSGVGVGDKGESFWHKITRQVADTKNLPHYLVHFATRFVTGSYASPSSPVSLTSSSLSSPSIPYLVPSHSPASTTTLVRDTFSFRQLLIVSTAHGKLFALDTSTGAIVWSRILGLGWARKVGGRIIPVRVFVVRRGEATAVNDVSEGREAIALVAQRVADNTLVDTVIFHFDPLTGEDIKILTQEDEAKDPRINVRGPDGKWVSVLEGVDAVAGPLVEVFLLPDGQDTIGMLDEFLQVRLYPDTPATRESLTSLAPDMYLALRAGTQVLGHQLGLNDDLSLFHVAFPTWGVSFSEDEEVAAIVKPAHKTPVANVGKVKGDRSTLYKYLNPHRSVVLSAPSHTSPPTSPSCGLHVVDTVKGTVLYHVTLPALDGSCDAIKVVLDEHWLVYAYYEPDAEGGSAKGYRVVSVEMYEGYGPDDKTSSSDMTSYSNATSVLSVFEQAYVVPHRVTAMATTTTKFGVSTRDIVVSSEKHGVHLLPHRLLDPRRPKRKPTADEVEEMLVQYDAVLPDDGRLVLSHRYEVANVRQIVTAPSLLESTSLVLAVGTDLFMTRVATSGTFDVLSENFNKVQLVLTVVGLGVAIAVTKPMVRRKRLRERWYQ